jgi:hypothetical protein
MKPVAASPSFQSSPSDTTKSVLTLWILLHGICVATALVGMVNDALLVKKLVRTFAVYLQPLHLDPGTSWRGENAHYFIALLPSTTNNSPASPIIVSEGRITQIAATVAQRGEQEELQAVLAKSLGGSLLRHHRLTSGRLQFRRQKTSAAEDSIDESELAYEADVWFGDDGTLYLQKHVDAPDGAPTATSSGRLTP